MKAYIRMLVTGPGISGGMWPSSSAGQGLPFWLLSPGKFALARVEFVITVFSFLN